MIYQGDLFDVLPTLPEASVDACVTDPPYGIGFMGKQWDSFKPGEAEKRIVPNRAIESDNPNLKGRLRGPASSPSAVEYNYTLDGLRAFEAWTEQWAREVFRVLKPGAYLVVCGAPRSYHRMACGLEDAGFVIRDKFAWLFGSGFPKNYNLGDGKGTALKPAHEPIALAWKPFKGSIRACHEQHGTAALNVDVCRLATTDAIEPFGTPRKSSGGIMNITSELKEPFEQNPLGRWPSNVLLDEEAARLLDEQTADSLHGAGAARGGGLGTEGRVSMFVPNGETNGSRYGDSGGASRFYYVAKPSREERDYGCDGLDPRQRDESRKEGNTGGDNSRNRGLQPRGNFHPTVKPVELMRWLVKLVTPIGGTVLDPFMGSGTTGMACRYELREFIGIEREAEYVEIAERRIAACVPLFGEVDQSAVQAMRAEQP